MAYMELKRSLGHCCPEPSCDYSDFKFIRCGMCESLCDDCIHNPKLGGKVND